MSNRAAHRTSTLAYPGTLGLLGLALAFPMALMFFNPTLMFERGWEQYVGTSLYIYAVIALSSELFRLWSNESTFAEAPKWLTEPSLVPAGERRVLPARIRQLGASSGSAGQVMELNQEASGLDQEQAAGRFTITKYILYLLPVIGFIGTVEGISKALMNISRVLPMVKDLDGFMSNLTSVTSALQIAFDSTLLALFLSAALMFVQTLVLRRSDDFLARVDRWIVDQILSVRKHETSVGADAALLAKLESVHQDLAALAASLGEKLGGHVDRFAVAVDRLPRAIEALSRGTEAIGRLGDDLRSVGDAGDSLRKGVATLTRIETALHAETSTDEEITAIRFGVDRQCAALEGMASQWANAFERSSKVTQEQLARTLGSLKDALDLLNVSMEQGNALYRSIVKSKFSVYREEAS